MPTPWELLIHPVSLTAIALFLGLILWEWLRPTRPLPPVKGWVGRGLIAFISYFLLSSYLPLWWDPYLAQWQWWDLTALATGLQVIIGLLVFETLNYAWHRSLHRYHWLWLGFHQMHHSAERLDSFGAFWLSPLDMAGFTFIGSLALVGVVGIGPEAATITLLIGFFLAVFQHTNINTPRWLGYLIQRPESHAYHHGRDLHKHNYANFPIMDMLFGTFVNPQHGRETGFYHGASSRLMDMLLWRDVSEPKQETPNTLEVL